ncbi:MAG TPA: hypothetical protein VFC54_05845 [Pseudolabrys sp.]|nr:hypothetical protein [Pseudolabrys sp.]
MSILLFGAGAIVFLAGAVMVGFGFPASDFSFGNSLIVAGTTAIVGGMIVAALGVAVSHLQNIADALVLRTPARTGRPNNAFEAGARPSPTQGRVPFPQRPKTDSKSEARDAAGGYEPTEQPFHEALDHYAPTLPNPDEPPLTVDEEVSLSPRHPIMPAARRTEPEEYLPPPPRQKTYFDSMWPTEPKTEPRAEPRTELRPEARPEPTAGSASAPIEPRADMRPQGGEDRLGDALSWQAGEHSPPGEPRTVAILKSGVVDGMGYTLYVDGSIEAELPQGTLHFASINELRSHLEKTS